MWPDAVTVLNADGERMEVGEVVAGNTALVETGEGGGRPAWLDNETVDMDDDQRESSESKRGKATATAARMVGRRRSRFAAARGR